MQTLPSYMRGDEYVMIGKQPPEPTWLFKLWYRIRYRHKFVWYPLPIGTIGDRSLLNAQGYPDSVLLPCEGQKYRADYWPELAAIYTNVYGAPTEPGMVQMPDLRGRRIVEVTSEYS